MFMYLFLLKISQLDKSGYYWSVSSNAINSVIIKNYETLD